MLRKQGMQIFKQVFYIFEKALFANSNKPTRQTVVYQEKMAQGIRNSSILVLLR